MKNLLVYFFFNMIVINFCFSQNSSSLYTKGKDSTYKYIWKVHISDPNDNNDNEYVMTGFKVKGVPYLVTALHGWAKGYAEFKNKPSITTEFFSVDSTSSPHIKCDKVSIKGADIEKDLLLLELKGCSYMGQKPFDLTSYQKEGLEIGEYQNDTTDVYKAYGFPSTIDPQTNKADISGYSQINKLVALAEKQFEILKKLKSPSLEVVVYSLNKACIVEGLSGCPLVNTKTSKVLGIGNGATVGDAGKSWAIKLQKRDITNPKLDKEIDKDDIKRTFAVYDSIYKKLAKFYKLGLLSAKVKKTTISVSSLISFPTASPKFIIGVSGGWLPNSFGLKINDLEVIPKSSNALADAFVEWRLSKKTPWLMIGGFFTANFLNYEISPNDLPPNVQPVETKSNNVMVGGQASILYSRGVLHHAYFGGGLGSYTSELNTLNNFRFYTGYRHYIKHRQRVSWDIKLLYINTKEKITTPNPFGNAIPILRTFNQYYLCFGLNYSIGLQK